MTRVGQPLGEEGWSDSNAARIYVGATDARWAGMPPRRHPRGTARATARAQSTVHTDEAALAASFAASALIPAQAPKFATLDALRAEHREMNHVLDGFERWGANLKKNPGRDARLEARQYVRYLRRFVADWHHAREEGILFEVLERMCAARERGPVTVMLHEHQVLDGLVAELDGLAAQPNRWGATEVERAAEIVVHYAEVARRHEVKEETVVYPMVESKLDRDARAEVVLRFEAFAASEDGEGIAELRRLGMSLAAPASGERQSGETLLKTLEPAP